ncbi:MAG: fumarylacetoacetate hydrolase family protein [Steroidobacter sp.]
MFHSRLKQSLTMTHATTSRARSSRNTIKTGIASMSLICLALGACNSTPQRLVDEIVTSWREHRSLPNIDETLTNDAAYRVQTRSVRTRLQAASPAGFKAGLTSPTAQARFKTNQAVAGVLFNEGARKSADTLRLSELRGLYVEVELAMRIGKRIDQPLADVSALREHIDGIAPALELPNIDYVDPQAIDIVDLIATNVSSANYIVGDFVSPELRDPNSVAVRLTCNDQEIMSGTARDALGDQWQSALWLVNTMLKQGWKIEPGQVLLTGALGRAIPASIGRCVAGFHAADQPWGTLSVNVVQ